jgi:predicted CopG family antitoxin
MVIISDQVILISDDMTTISLRKGTRDLLKEIGKKSETYDDIIRRLIELQKKEIDRLHE